LFSSLHISETKKCAFLISSTPGVSLPFGGSFPPSRVPLMKRSTLAMANGIVLETATECAGGATTKRPTSALYRCAIGSSRM
jgi:hypothetical protein